MVKAIIRLLALFVAPLLCAAPLQAASLTVTWDPNPEPNVTYTVYWGAVSGTYSNNAAAGAGLSYQVDDLTPGATYYFAVKATTTDGLESPFSDEVVATIPGTTPRLVRGDFSGAGKTDYTVFRNSTGTWYVRNLTAIRFGVSTDVPVPGDYDGDGLMDIAIWRPSTGAWMVLKSSEDFATATRLQIAWGRGSSGDVPVPADYDGDGRTDLAVFRVKTCVFYILLSTEAYATTHPLAVQLGSYAKRDLPVPADYDGDGLVDLAVWRPSTGVWYILTSSSGYETLGTYQWGSLAQNDIPVPADYDGDGITDLAVWRQGTGVWFIRFSGKGFSTSDYLSVQWGLRSRGDIPVPGDFDGDGKADLAVWRPSNGTWYVLQSSASYSSATSLAIQWGARTDKPVTGTEPLALSGLVTLR